MLFINFGNHNNSSTHGMFESESLNFAELTKIFVHREINLKDVVILIIVSNADDAVEIACTEHNNFPQLVNAAQVIMSIDNKVVTLTCIWRTKITIYPFGSGISDNTL